MKRDTQNINNPRSALCTSSSDLYDFLEHSGYTSEDGQAWE